MSKLLIKDSFPAQYKSLENKVTVIQRMIRKVSSVPSVNTTALTNKEIDEKVFGASEESSVIAQDGKVIYDPVNHLILGRVKSEWKSIGEGGKEGPPGPEGSSGEPGDFKWSARETAGTGWIGPCVGQEVLASEYEALALVLGTGSASKYGAAKVGYFTLPNGTGGMEIA